MYSIDAEVRARYEETDQMGVVYYGNYYTWFEVGRNEFMRSLGMSYRDLEQAGVLLPAVESHCVYKIPARYDDLILIRTRVRDLSGVKISFGYEVIRKEDRALLAHGKTVHAFVDVGTFKPVNIKRRYREYYDKLLNCICTTA